MFKFKITRDAQAAAVISAENEDHARKIAMDTFSNSGEEFIVTDIYPFEGSPVAKKVYDALHEMQEMTGKNGGELLQIANDMVEFDEAMEQNTNKKVLN